MITTRVLCYARCGKPARVGKRFCSNGCGSWWGEKIAAGNDDVFCPTTGEWEYIESGDSTCLGCEQSIENHSDSGKRTKR